MKILTHHFPSSYHRWSRRKTDLLIHQSISSNPVVSFTIPAAQSTADGLLSTIFFVLFPFFRDQLLFQPYLFLQSCFLQSCLPSFCILSCSAALLDVQCSMVCSCMYPMVVHLFPGRGNGHQGPARSMKESKQQAAFYQVSVQCQAKRAGMKGRRCDVILTPGQG